MHSALESLSVPTVVYKPAVRVGRSWVYIRSRRKRGHSRQQAGSHRKADRKELGWRRSQDHSRAARALALARFLRNRLRDGGGRDGAHAHDDCAYDAHGLGLPKLGLWTSTREG
jgi:hypothetical protein